MRYRKLTSSGDMVFGRSKLDYLQDQPEAVAQAVQTRLLLLLGEWFLDTTDGTPWASKVLGKYTEATRLLVLSERILATPGVLTLDSLNSNFDPNTRTYSLAGTVGTLYGQAAIAAATPARTL